MRRVHKDDLDDEIMDVERSLASDKRQIHAHEYQLHTMRRALKRKQARLARLKRRRDR